MKYNYWVFRSYLEKDNISIDYNNIFFFKIKNIYSDDEDVTIRFNYSYRMFFFFKINEFIIINNISKNFFFNIIFTYYKTLFNIFLFKKDYNYYYYLLKLSFIKYNNLFLLENNFLINTSKNIFNFLNLKKTSIKNFNIYNLKKFENIFKNNWNNSIKSMKLLNDNYFLNIYEYNLNDFGENNFKINFLRVQRRYNKRRYSKVRSWSRSPFLAGISLSSIFLSMFWIGTVKFVDWNNIFIIIININTALLFIYLYIYYRFFKLKFFKNAIRKKNKIKIINYLHKMFFLNWFINYKNE